jgi:hypothetical protein
MAQGFIAFPPGGSRGSKPGSLAAQTKFASASSSSAGVTALPGQFVTGSKGDDLVEVVCPERSCLTTKQNCVA